MNDNKILDLPQLEVLSPAGDFESLKAAVQFGADAVYLGSTMFTMRVAPENFGGEKLKQAVDFAHENGVKVYLTCNTLPRGEELAGIEQFFVDAKNSGVDAFIINDIGVLSVAKEIAPEVDVHISTQAGIVNHLTANAFYKMGVKRIVLARELSFEEITFIRQNTPPDLEIEAFVHGAMCMSVSGRCLLSDYMVGRDANRGACAQPCRWGYYLMEEKRPGEYYQIFEDEKGSYILNAKDMCMIEHIDLLAKCGITSLKIEGRAKSAYYVATITNAYRNAVDLFYENPNGYYCPDWIKRETELVSHRRYTTGFYFGRQSNSQYYENGGYLRQCDIVGIVKEHKDKILYCSQKNKFSVGDEIEFLIPKQKSRNYTVKEIFNEDGKSVESANHAEMDFTLKYDGEKIPSGSIIRMMKKEN